MVVLPVGRQGKHSPLLNITAIDTLHFYSPLVKGAWSGCLVHLSGLDVIGATAGSIARLLQDREIELWEGKRIVSSATNEEVMQIYLFISAQILSCIHSWLLASCLSLILHFVL